MSDSIVRCAQHDLTMGRASSDQRVLPVALSGPDVVEGTVRPTTADHQDMPLPEEGILRLAIISDTHSSAHPGAADLVRDAKPDLILHAGDIGAEAVLAPFEDIARTLCVRGNIDSANAAPDVLSVHVRGEEGYELRILMRHIALFGPRLRRDAKQLVGEHQPHLLICGHSHVPFLAQEGDTVIFNPGSVGPRRFALPICFGLMELGPGHTKIRHIDCESGETWLPPAL